MALCRTLLPLGEILKSTLCRKFAFKSANPYLSMLGGIIDMLVRAASELY